MKAYLEQLLIPDNEIFLLKRNQLPVFTAMHHQHRELEFKYMVSGTGKGFIGDTIYEYKAGDLVLAGPNLPHHWQSDNHFEEKGIIADCVYIQFKEDFLGDEFYQKSDMVEIGKMFQIARHGIQFSGQTAQEAGKKILELSSKMGFERLMGFLSLLHFLSTSFEYRILSNVGFANQVSLNEEDRLNKIYQYITRNFKYEVNLNTAASQVSMSKSAFCQYFKKRTLKSFSDFVNEVRINNATRLILDKDKSISEACYESGFNNISYFNRKFKEINKMSPKNFIKSRI